jgi:predicted RNA-binding Zn ribbon-like protein
MQSTYATKKITRRRPPRFELTGGALCLDFINTMDHRASSEPKELLKSYLDLARFAEDTGALDSTQVDHLMERSYVTPEPAQRALVEAIELREAMYQVCAAIMKKKPAPAAALATVNQYVQGAAQYSRLVESKGHFEWRFDAPANTFEAPLWPIARSAADLLASEQLQYVHECSSPTCQWLFLDTSKNHRRRWCDMKVCGNRAKFRRFYSRQKAKASTMKATK